MVAGKKSGKEKLKKLIKKAEKSEKKKEQGLSRKQISEELDEAEEQLNGGNVEGRSELVMIKASKPISKVKKGDKIKIDGKELEVDAHYVLIDHGTTKEMALEVFDSKTDKDYQLRYFDDQVESTLELYELQEIMFVRKQMQKVEW